MRKTVFCIFAPLILLSAGISFAADTTQKKDTPDPRLSKLVTINCPYVRLSDVIQQISEQTGVTIRAGRNTDDWKVRDLPMIVCAKDIHLGPLLRAIADSTHLGLTAQEVNGVRHYRLWRDMKREKAFQNYNEARKAADEAAKSYDWDTWCKISELPEDELEKIQGHDRIKSSAKLISALTPDYKERVLNGEWILIRYAEAPDALKTIMKQVFKDSCAFSSELNSSTPAFIDSDDNCNQSHISITSSYNDDKPARVDASITVRGSTAYPTTIMPGMEWISAELRRQGCNIPPRPEYPEPPKELQNESRYSKLQLSDTDLDLPKTVKLVAPKDKKKLINGDVLSAFSDATGWAVVAEDFQSHMWKPSWESKLDTNFGRELTMREFFSWMTWLDGVFDKWYVDKNSKILVGQSEDWVNKHDNLVPRSLIDSLKAKLNEKGLSIDDLEPFTELNTNQINEWFMSSGELETLQAISNRFRDIPFLKLYYALDASDRAKVLAGDPIPLEQLDKDFLNDILKESIKRTRQQGEYAKFSIAASNRDVEKVDRASEEIRTKTEKQIKLLSDQENLEIRLQKSGKDRFYYLLTLGDEKLYYLGPFPMYSPEREKELQKAKSQK